MSTEVTHKVKCDAPGCGANSSDPNVFDQYTVTATRATDGGVVTQNAEFCSTHAKAVWRWMKKYGLVAEPVQFRTTGAAAMTEPQPALPKKRRRS